MDKSLLITSFDIWEAHHVTNAADDLVGEFIQRWPLPDLQVLRHLPVDFELAPARVIAALEGWQPQVVICCGMAEQRSRLTVESCGCHLDEVMTTAIDLENLIADLAMTDISHDAGRFVCNYLYYSVLKFIQTNQLPTQCIFVHVPLLNQRNIEPIVADFARIVQRMQRC